MTHTVAEVVADALPAICRQCCAPACEPCDCTPGVHAGRLVAAHRRGFVGDLDLVAVLGALGAFTLATVVAPERDLVAS